MNTIKGLVGKDKEYRADIASTLGTRIANYLEVYSKENPIEKDIIDRVSKIVTDKVFATDVSYNMVKSIYNSNPNKFKLMMLNKELVKYITK
jgi:signal recognition particle GTPase